MSRNFIWIVVYDSYVSGSPKNKEVVTPESVKGNKRAKWSYSWDFPRSEALGWLMCVTGSSLPLYFRKDHGTTSLEIFTHILGKE